MDNACLPVMRTQYEKNENVHNCLLFTLSQNFLIRTVALSIVNFHLIPFKLKQNICT